MKKIIQILGQLAIVYLVFCLNSFNALGQSNIVRGTITSDQNEPLPGVNVIVKNTSIGTITDVEGKYSIEVADPQGVLVFSYIGYVSEEVSINGRNVINFSLVPDIKSLSELVVVGYGEQSRRELTGAVSSVKAKELENIPVVSADALLQGRAAGVVVINNSGAPGSGVSVRIRGTGSLNASNEPLYVVDGVPITSAQFGDQLAGGGSVSPIADLNPNDIESMEILKDAAATAIYGARGANGVVLITTKRGAEGSSRLTFNAYTGITQAPPKLPLLNGPEAKTMFLEGASNQDAGWFGQWPNLLDDPTHPEYPLFRHDTDWQDLVRQDGVIQDYNVAFRGGDKKSTFALSTGYTSQTGTVVGSGYERFTASVNADFKVSEKFVIRNSLRFTRSKTNRIDEGNNFNTNPYAVAMFKMPFLSRWRIDPITGEEIVGVYAFSDFQDRNNPYQISQLLENNQWNNRAIGNIEFTYDILPGLSFTSRVGIDYFGLKESRFAPNGIRGVNRQAYEQWTQDLTWLNENLLNYRKTFNDRHHFSALVGYTNQKSKLERISGSTDRMIDNTIQTLNAGPNFRNIGSRIDEWGLTSLLGRFSYTYEDKYSIEVNARRDGSSRFGENNKFAFFPSASAYWRVSSEPFFDGIGAINDFKIRGSYGQVGNQDIPTGAALNLYSLDSYSGYAAVAQSNLAAESLSWETTTMANIGIDASFLNNKFTIMADYFNNTTDDLLVRRSLPNTSGFGSIWDNVGSIRNSGIELQIISRIIQSNDVNWKMDFNIARNTNEILSLLDDQDLIEQRDGFVGIARVGESLGTFYGWVANGVYATDAENQTELRNANGYLFKGGDVIFTDVNDDGVIDNDDRVVIGNNLPDFFGGVNNTFSYKNFDLNVFLQFEYGKDVINASRQRLSNAGGSDNSLTSTLRRWRQQGDVTDIPIARRGEQNLADNNRQSTRWVEDGSYIRIKTVMLGYNIPTKVFKDKISRARVYIAGNNLLTLTKYLGQDPEFAQPNNPILNGIDYFNYPQSRVYTVGVNVTF